MACRSIGRLRCHARNIEKLNAFVLSAADAKRLRRRLAGLAADGVSAQSHLRHQNTASGISVVMMISPHAHAYPQAQSYSGMLLKFMP